MTDVCVIFDLDGTLVDSESLCNQAFLDLLPDLDGPLEELVPRYRGLKLASILTDIEACLHRKLPPDFEQTYRNRVSELFESELRPTPGALEMLQSIQSPICLASSGPIQKIHQALRVSGLSTFFGENVFSSYEVGSWKPEPGLFLHAATAMGFEAGQCIVVEDSRPGIEAAIAAGMKAFWYSPDKRESGDRTGVTFFAEMRELPSLLRGMS